MISPSREQIAVALFALLQTMGNSFATYSRRPKLWDQSTAMPALYVGNPQEEYTYQHGTAAPAHITLDFDIFIYINVALDPNSVPDTLMNSLLDKVEATLGGYAINGQAQTLGGIVNHVWMEGTIHRVPGYLDGHGMALFTIRVLVPT